MSEIASDGLVDSEQLETLVASAGTEAAQAILDAFWQSCDQLVADLTTCMAENRDEEAARAAHALKGSAANLGAVAMVQTSRDIEQALRAGQSEAVQAGIAKIREDMKATRTAFEALIARLAA